MYIKDEKEKNLRWMVLFGIILLVMPSALISVSVKYQKEVEWFKGYIPAYFGSWGLALVVAVAIVYVGRKLAGNKKTFICFNVAMASLITIVFAFNSIVGSYSVQDADNFYQNDVDTMKDSIDAGLLDDIGMEYVLDTSYATYTLDPGYTNRAYTTWLKKKNNIAGWDDIYADKGESAALNNLYDTMKMDGFKVLNHLTKWYVVLADCNNLQLSLTEDGYNYKVYTDSIDIFLYDYFPDSFSCLDAQRNKVTVNVSDGNVIKTGRYGKVYHFSFSEDIDINSIVIGD